MNSYDIIVIGGGHAGIEAARASALMNCSTALITMSEATIGVLSCNPSIGGSAKGHLVKEIDAIGGIMPLIADRSGLQFKMLNTSKGPAIWSPRSQNDKFLYPKYARQALKQTKNRQFRSHRLLARRSCIGVQQRGLKKAAERPSAGSRKTAGRSSAGSVTAAAVRKA